MEECVRWISSKEAAPELNENILFHTKNDDIIWMGTSYSDGVQRCVIANAWTSNVPFYEAVDYWMKIPPIPQKDNVQECAENAHCTERTAKILNRSEGFYSAHGVCICGHCEHCGNAVCDDFKVCPYCGIKLDWSDDENIQKSAL